MNRTPRGDRDVNTSTAIGVDEGRNGEIVAGRKEWESRRHRGGGRDHVRPGCTRLIDAFAFAFAFAVLHVDLVLTEEGDSLG